MSAWFAALQRGLPQHALSRLAGRVAASETDWVKSLFIRQFARVYDISLDEAECTTFDEFRSFNDFFTRALRADARPIGEGIVSPADGCVSQLGQIDGDTLLQAKGHGYSLTSLAGGLAGGFSNGTFCTVYLAPSDYHRVHLPFAGTLTDTLAVPGALYSVNAATETSIEGLFARNERLVCRFETEFGPMLVVLVGAMIVASIATDWAGPVSPYNKEEHTQYDLVYETGEEIGRFLLGSTVICCFPPGAVTMNESLASGTAVRMGQTIAFPTGSR